MATRTAIEMIQVLLGVDRRTADRFARELVARLEPKNYSGTVRFWDGTWADEYGIVADGVSWYVKLQMDAMWRLHIVSCHLPDRDIHTVAGTVTCTQHGVRPYE